MDPGHRRRPSPRAAGSLILLALLVLATGGWVAAATGLLVPGAHPALAADGEEEGGGRLTAGELAARPAASPRRGALDGRFAAIARRWIDEAARRSKNAAHAGNVRVSVAAREVETGVELASLEADRSMRPASNMKLVTTAAALVLLGGGSQFRTPFEAHGPVEGGVLHGDLVVRAAGDPLCAADGDPRVEHRLGAVAREIRAAGVAVVEGDLVLDEGRFLEPGPGPAWPDASQHWA